MNLYEIQEDVIIAAALLILCAFSPRSSLSKDVHLHELLAPAVKFSDVESILSRNVRDIFSGKDWSSNSGISVEKMRNDHNTTNNENGNADKDSLTLLRSGSEVSDEDQLQDFPFSPSNDTTDEDGSAGDEDDRATTSVSTLSTSASMPSIHETSNDDIEEQQASSSPMIWIATSIAFSIIFTVTCIICSRRRNLKKEKGDVLYAYKG